MKIEILLTLTLCCILTNTHSQELTSGLLERSEVPEKYKWDTRDLYETEEGWHRDYTWVLSNIPEYNSFKGKLEESPDLLLRCLQFDEEIRKRLDCIRLYAKLNRDVEMHNAEAQKRWSEYIHLNSKVEAARSYIRPELIAIPRTSMDQYMSEQAELSVYGYYFNALQNRNSHTLSPDREEFLARVDPLLENPYKVFGSLVYAELPFPVIQDEVGEKLQLNRSTSWRARSSQDRRYRKTGYQAYYQSLGNYQATLTRNLSAFVEGKVLLAETRNYQSALEASLDRYQIPEEVYHKLIHSVGMNLQALHRWMKIKKEVLKVDTLFLYDTRVSMFPGSEKKMNWEEAQMLTMESLGELGGSYLEDIQIAYDKRWIDAYPNRGKETGGYSSGPAGPHPYVKMNWGDELFDFYTLVHELGHFVHAMKTMKSQPYIYWEYPSFLSEVASTTAENISQLYLIDQASQKEKLYHIEKYLDNVVLNIYNSCMMAEFELMLYQTVESGESLSPQFLNNQYKELLSKYYGPEVYINELDSYAWMEYPHYYLDFYLYSYSTSFSAAIQIAREIKEEGAPARESFIEFLESGNSDYPTEILKEAGVDLGSPIPYQAVSQMMNELMDILVENM